MLSTRQGSHATSGVDGAMTLMSQISLPQEAPGMGSHWAEQGKYRGRSTEPAVRKLVSVPVLSLTSESPWPAGEPLWPLIFP